MPTFSPSSAIRMLAFFAAAFAVTGATAADAPQHQYSIKGSLTPATQVSASGAGLQLTSRISTHNDLLVPVQEGAGLALIATLASVNTACYNDTIFRDSFDGTGL